MSKLRENYNKIAYPPGGHMISFDNYSDFPTSGSKNTYYRDKSDNKIYQWTGNAYEQTNAAGSAGGQVDSIVAGTNVTVDDSDPINPTINVPEKTSVTRTKVLEVFMPSGTFNTPNTEEAWGMQQQTANTITSDISWNASTAVATINTPGWYRIISNPFVDQSQLSGNNRKYIANNIRITFDGVSTVSINSIYLRYSAALSNTRIFVTESAYLPSGATVETYLLITSQQTSNNVIYKSGLQDGNRGFTIIKEDRSS